MKNLCTCILMAMLVCSVTADAQNLYQRTYKTSNTLYGIDISWSASDQTFVLSSMEYESPSGTYIRIIKTDQDGYPLWTQRITSTGVNSSSVAVDPTGNIYCVAAAAGGSSSSDVAYEVTSFSSWGSVNWSKEFATSTYGVYDKPDIAVLSDGNLLLTESVWGHLGFLKISPSGTLIKAVSICEDTSAEAKTPGFSSTVMPDGSFLFTGKRDSDILLTHTDDQGNILWSRQWNSGTNYYHTKTICTSSDGTSMLGGYELSNIPFIMKVDNSGNMVWYKWLSLTGTVRSIKQINATEFIAVVEENNAPTLVKFDSNGNVLSSVEMGGSTSATFYETALLVTPQGKIAWLLHINSILTGEAGMALMIMDSFTSTGCGMQPVTITTSNATADPLPIVMQMYKRNQVITDTVQTATISPSPINYLDFCWVVDVPSVQPVTNTFSLQNTPASQGENVTFSFAAYNGAVLYYVTDALGREVIRRNVNYNGGLQPIENSDQLARGIYMMTTVINGETQMRKFVIR